MIANMAKNKPDNVQKISMEELTSFAKRRGFVFAASEIYGGLAGFWDSARMEWS